VFYRLRRSIKYFKFNRQVRRILDTPPLAYKEGPLTIVTMVAGYDVTCYLLAMKSLYRRLGRGKIVAIVADDVSQSSRELIRQHLGPVKFVDIKSIDTGDCQRGGTWERLVYILDHTPQEYYIQMDCDILSVGPIPEVLECVDQNRAFTLADGIPKKPLTDWAAGAIERQGNLPVTNVVNEFEKLAPNYPGAAQLQYLRGSSGFAGFAKGAQSRASLEDFHRKSSAMLGPRWTEWGTEQIASNFIVANSPESVGLPKPKYLNWEHHKITEDTSLLHFLGHCRFDHGVYQRLANREIDALLGLAP
jgi:hypothetical protein